MNEENWKAIPGYEDLYEASDLGNIRSLKFGKVKVLKAGIGGGYYRVVLCKGGKTKSFLVHRLVWVSFNGEIPRGLSVNHRNEIKTDNRLENLELVTHTQNMNWGTRNERISAALKGKAISAERSAKISASMKGKKRKPLSEETKAKISAARKGGPSWRKGRKLSEAHKAKISAAQKARYQREKEGIIGHIYNYDY